MYNGVLVNVSARMRERPDGAGRPQHRFDRHRQLRHPRAICRRSTPTNPFCRDNPGLVTRLTGLAAYTVPKIDVLVSGTFRSDQGTPLQANYVVTSAEAAKSLGRPLSGGAPNVTVNLLEPGEVWGDRVNDIDLRMAKILRFGRTRTNVGVDVYNLFNSSAVLNYNQAYNPVGTWLTPTTVCLGEVCENQRGVRLLIHQLLI